MESKPFRDPYRSSSDFCIKVHVIDVKLCAYNFTSIICSSCKKNSYHTLMSGKCQYIKKKGISKGEASDDVETSNTSWTSNNRYIEHDVNIMMYKHALLTFYIYL